MRVPARARHLQGPCGPQEPGTGGGSVAGNAGLGDSQP